MEEKGIEVDLEHSEKHSIDVYKRQVYIQCDIAEFISKSLR